MKKRKLKVNNIILPVLVLLVYLTPTIADAKNDSDLRANLINCSKITSDNARLHCFDKLISQRNKQTVAVVTSAAVSTKLPSPILDEQKIEQKRVDSFAQEHLKKTKEKQGPKSIVSTVTKLKKLIRGQWVIFLENGQKWQQKDTARLNLKVGNKVRLDKGAMGAVYLYKEGTHRSIKVKRLE